MTRSLHPRRLVTACGRSGTLVDDRNREGRRGRRRGQGEIGRDKARQGEMKRYGPIALSVALVVGLFWMLRVERDSRTRDAARGSAGEETLAAPPGAEN